MNQRLLPRELAYSGVFGAAALLLPVLFHLVRLGAVFMPMYLPLVALAFFKSRSRRSWASTASGRPRHRRTLRRCAKPMVCGVRCGFAA